MNTVLFWHTLFNHTKLIENKTSVKELFYFVCLRYVNPHSRRGWLSILEHFMTSWCHDLDYTYTLSQLKLCHDHATSRLFFFFNEWFIYFYICYGQLICACTKDTFCGRGRISSGVTSVESRCHRVCSRKTNINCEAPPIVLLFCAKTDSLGD